MEIKEANLFMTGGAGTLGKAIARKRRNEGWTGKLTIYSTDAGKHNAMRKLYPDVKFIQGDIRNLETMRLAMVGHDIVIHAAAVKFIPDSEYASIDTIDVNVYGSQIVCEAARWAGVSKVLGISTDKACHPANAYGSTKHLMEKIFQENARFAGGTTELYGVESVRENIVPGHPTFHLVRYGNVLESRGSVIETWKTQIELGSPVFMTNSAMTRFWLSPSQAADMVVKALEIPNGMILVPKMPALSIEKLFQYAIGEENATKEIIPMRPGEKIHETLITEDELEYVVPVHYATYWILKPSTSVRKKAGEQALTPYTSENAPELTKDELLEMLKDE